MSAKLTNVRLNLKSASKLTTMAQIWQKKPYNYVRQTYNCLSETQISIKIGHNGANLAEKMLNLCLPNFTSVHLIPTCKYKRSIWFSTTLTQPQRKIKLVV